MGLAAWAGCKCAEPKPADPTVVENKIDVMNPPLDAQRQADLAALPQGGGSLSDLLAAEAAARPKDTGTLEAIIATAGKDGVAFGPTRQAWGQKQLAIYCASADSTDGVLVTVCEYPSPEQAGRGEKEANVIQGKLPLHQSVVRKKSVLHVVPRSDAPPETVKKILAAFDAS